MIGNWLLFGTVLLVALWYLAPYVLRRRGEAHLARRVADQGVVVLSYDDGPGQTLTPDLLDLLAAEQVQATFFMIGDAVDAAPEVAARVLEAGHEGGSHTMHHHNAWKTGPLRATRDITQGVARITAAGGQGKLFRPPYGKMTLGGLCAGALLGLRYGWWSVDPRDSWAPRPPEDVLRQIEAQGGGVVLMHDFDAPRRSELQAEAHKAYVLSLTRDVIALARRQGYSFKTLGEVLDR